MTPSGHVRWTRRNETWRRSGTAGFRAIEVAPLSRASSSRSREKWGLIRNETDGRVLQTVGNIPAGADPDADSGD